jgi:predicted ATPase/class 3 adenylate cyclase
MSNLATYIPLDRRRALARGESLPDYARGAVFFADISGFTPLTELLVQKVGPRQGADALARQLNRVYGALIADVHRQGGSVIGFSGDAITCWFDAAQPDPDAPGADLPRAALRAITAALAMQQSIARLATIPVAPDLAISLSVKASIAAGRVRRFLVGDPDRQVIDVLAGSLLDRMAAGEQVAQSGEVVLDGETARLVGETIQVQAWRAAADQQFAVLDQAAGRERLELNRNESLQDLHLPLDEAEMRSWVLPGLYERMTTGQERYMAELRPAAALFIKFSGLDYDRDTDAGAKLDAYVRWVQSVLARYEGSLIQVTTGDKGSYLYLAFGAPLAHDDDARRAVAAALELRQPPQHLSYITGVQLGVGQGRMRVGAYGSETRRTYGVLGDATNLAARLMSHAQPGQILVSQNVAEAIGAHFHLRDLGEIAFKGKQRAQRVHAVVGQRAQLADPHATLYAHPLVGRDAELARFDALLVDLARRRAGHILQIEGEAGIGKSHLVNVICAQAVKRVGAGQLRVAIGACQSMTRGVAYFAVRQLLRNLLGLPEDRLTESAADPLAARNQLESIVAQLNPAWLPRLPLLGDLLGVPVPDNEMTAAFDAQMRQEALITLALEIVQALARQRPLLLVLDDVHWLDEASQAIVLALARTLADQPVLLLLVHRPATLEAKRLFREVAALAHRSHWPLAELPAAGIAALVSQRLGGEVSPLALALIQALSQGNPFYTEELVDAMLDTGRLVVEDDCWTLSQDSRDALRRGDCLVAVGDDWTLKPDAPLSAVDLGIPDSIHGIVLSRLDRLPEPVKLTLKVASIIGRTFELDVLVRAHPAAPAGADLHAQIELLLTRDFARVETPEPQPRYIFKHTITQEVIYRTLLEDQRHELHCAVGETLEQLLPGEIERLAHHFHSSDLHRPAVRTKALTYLGAAGERAQRSYANEIALSYYERALALEKRWAWQKARVAVLHILGRREEERVALTEADAAPPLDVALLWGDYYESISDYERAVRSVEGGLLLADKRGNETGAAQCLNRLGMIAWRQGDYDGAERYYRDTLLVVHTRSQLPREEAEARYGLSLVYRQLGRYDAAEEQLARNLALCRQLDDRQAEARALNSMGHLEHLRRNFPAAVARYEESLQIRQTIGDRAGIGTSLLSLAQGVSSLGDHGRAEPLLRKALQIHQALGDRWSSILIRNELGILYMMIGQLDRAEHALSEGLALSREIGDESGQAYILCNLGQVLRDGGHLARAEAMLAEGLAMAQEQGDAHLEAICFSDLATISLATGRHAEAIARAQASSEKFLALELSVSTTADHVTLAQAHLELGEGRAALRHVQIALNILEECGGVGPDFPQRDYWLCHRVLRDLGDGPRAERALARAHAILREQAQKISDAAMRQSYLENVWFNRAIAETVELACVS